MLEDFDGGFVLDLVEFTKFKIQKAFDKLDAKKDPLKKAAAIKRMMKVAEEFATIDSTQELYSWIQQELNKRRFELNKIM